MPVFAFAAPARDGDDRDTNKDNQPIVVEDEQDPEETEAGKAKPKRLNPKGRPASEGKSNTTQSRPKRGATPPKGKDDAGQAKPKESRNLPEDVQRRLDEARRNRDANRAKGGDKNKAATDADQEADDKKPKRPNRRTRAPKTDPKDEEAAKDQDGRRSTPRRGSRESVPGRSGKSADPKPGPSGPTTKIDLPPMEEVTPPEERMYSVSFKDVTYAQLLEGVNRLTGLAILGELPRDGKVSFVADEEVSFDELLRRVRLLLYEYKPHEPYWMKRTKTGLKVVRINDEYRNLPPERIFSSVAGYRAANLPEDEIALVKYWPSSGSISDLTIVRDFMPDYVRISQFGGENAITIFAVVKDIEKYFKLIERLLGADGERIKDDIRTLTVIPVEHVTPTEAWDAVQELMNLEAEGGKSRGGRGGRGNRDASPLENMPPPPVSVVPNDAQGVLVVNAMQDKIDEIKRFLNVIDVDTAGEDFSPVVVRLEHVMAEDIIPVLESIIVASSPDSDDKGTSRPRASSRKKRGKRSSSGSTSGSADGVTMIAHPSANAIVVLGPEESVKTVQQLVQDFDVPTEQSPTFIPINHVDATEIVATLTTLFAGEGKGAQPRFQLTPDTNGGGLWYMGPESDLQAIQEIIAAIDVAGDEVKLRVVRLKNRVPSFVVTVLTAYDATGATEGSAKSSSGKRKRRASVGRKAASGGGGKFNADDDNMRLFILCTDDEWAAYEPIINELEAETEVPPDFVVLPVDHITPDDAMYKLQTLMETGDGKRGGGGQGGIRFETTDGGIIVSGAGNDDLEKMRALLAIIDVEGKAIVMRTFQLKHVMADEMVGILAELVEGAAGAGGGGGRKSARKTAPVSSTDGPPLTIVPVADKIVVRSTEEKVSEIADLIAQFDVDVDNRTMRIHANFPPGSDVETIADTVRSLLRDGKHEVRKKEEAAGLQIVAQPETSRIIVIANEEEHVQIETLIEVLKTERKVPTFVTELVDVHFADPLEVVELVAPILEMRIEQLLADGELTGSPKAQATPVRKGKTPRGSARAEAGAEWYHMESDARQRRVVITAPQVVIDHAVKLIERFDDEGVTEDQTERLVKLKHAAPDEMVKTIRDLMSGKGRAPRASGKRDAPSQGDLATGPFEIVESPGSPAVFLRGMPELVEQAASWIELLDSVPIPNREIRVFNLECSDPKQVTDFIVNTLPAPTAAGKKPARPRRRATEDAEEDEWVTKITRTVDDVYIEADLISDVLIVAATPDKFVDIASIIDQFDQCDNGGLAGGMVAVPKFTYELQHAKDAMDAAWDLENVLSDLWPYPETPKVSSAFWADVLIVEYPHEDKFDEIREYIRKYIDVPDPDANKPKRVILTPPEGMSPEAFMNMIAAENPSVLLKELKTNKEEKVYPNIRRLQPCVVPVRLAEISYSLNTMLSAVESAMGEEAPEQRPERDRPDPEGSQQEEPTERKRARPGKTSDQEATTGGDDDKPRRRPTPKTVGTSKSEVRYIYDPESNRIIVEGPADALESITDSVETIEEELKDMPEPPPDIRIFRLTYIDVNTAASIIDQMFNATRQQRLQQQQAARRAQQQQARNQRQQNQQQQQQQQDQRGQRGQRGRQGQQNQQQQQQVQLPPTTVRVVPNARDRTLIVRAASTQYPAILEMLSVIDRPKPVESTFRTYQLEKLNASEVEELLENMLQLDVPRRRARATGAQGGARARRDTSLTIEPGQALPETIVTPTTDGDGMLGVDPSDIKINSNEAANTILVMAPNAALDYIGEIIKQLEAQNVADREWQSWELKYATADDTVAYLENRFGASSSGRGGRGARDSGGGLSGRSLNAPKFVSYPRLNMVSAEGTVEQLADIDKEIRVLDIRGEAGEWDTVSLVKADAKVVADLLTSMFSTGSSQGKRGRETTGAGPQFVGEEGSRVLFYSAPETMREEILAVIQQKEDSEVAKTMPRIIELQYAKATSVAEAIQAAFGTTSGGRRARTTGAQFNITGHDESKRLFVVADDETFKEISSLAVTLDQVPTTGFDFRIFPLQHANARKVYDQLSNLMKDYLQRLGGDRDKVEPFSVEVDEKSNSLVVLGSPSVFGFLEENLMKIDIPANAVSPPGFLMVTLKNAVAQEVAQNINQLWSGKTLPAGEVPPVAQSNKATNTLIVKGTQSQLDDIKSKFVDPLEQQQVAKLQTETFTLEHAQPELVAETINKIFEDKKRIIQQIGRDKGNPIEFLVVATADVATKQVVVQASEDNLAFVRERVSILDRPENAASSALAMRVYPIKYAEPASVANIITQWARSRSNNRNASASEMVTAVAEGGTRSVVVTASDTNHITVKELIDSLDDESVATQQRKQHVLKLSYANASELAHHFTTIFRSMVKRRGDPGPTFVAEANSNSLIASVNDVELEEVLKLTKTLDIEPPLDSKRTIEVYNLKYADPSALNNVVLTMFRWDRRGQGSPAEQVSSSFDWGARSLIVTASPKNHELIRAMIAKADIESAVKKENFLYDLEHATAEAVATTLTSALSNRRSTGRGDQPVTVVADSATNKLLINATKMEYDEIKPLIAALDTEEAVSNEVRVVQLTFGDATEMKRAVDEVLASTGGGRRGGGRTLIGGVRVSALPQGNSLVLSGPKKELDDLETQVREMDAAGKDAAAPKIVRLEHAKAARVVPTLMELFVEGQRGGGRRGAEPTSISPVEGMNAVLVKADPREMVQIEAVIAQLDTKEMEDQQNFRLIPVPAGYNINDLAFKVEEAVNNQPTRGTGGRGRGGRGQTPTISVA
jgi:type II secretory pathway component GspD/PulD (secretin)